MRRSPAQKRMVVAMSTSCLDYYPEPHGIRILRLNVRMGDDTFIDGSTLSCDDLHHWLLSHPTQVATTSLPTSLVLRKFFLGLMDEGYREVLFVGTSSALNKMNETIQQIAPLVQNKMKIHVFDSKTGMFTEGLMALEAEKCFNKGWSLKKTLKRLEMLRECQHVFLGLDNVQYLTQNGALSQPAGLLAHFLNVKPVIQFNQEGQVVVLDKIISTQRVMHKIAERIQPYTKNGEYQLFTLYSGNPQSHLHRTLQSVLTTQHGLHDLPAYPINALIATEIGPHAFGVGVFKI